MFSPTLLTSASALCIPFLLLATTDSDKASGAAGSGSPSHTLLTTGVGVGTGGESPLGTNLAPLSHYSTQIAFKDLFEQASRWYPQETTSYTWDTGQPIDLDADGWVRSLATDQAAGVLLARNLQGHYPAGEYTIRYQGTGVLEVHLDGAVSASQPGEMTVDVNPSDAGIHLKLVETDAL
ncbi:MAG: putative iron-regulated membrane protein, partial [Planctomycetota bacterium]